MFMFGGYDNVYGTNNDLYEYNVTESVWKKITPVEGAEAPAPRHGHFVSFLKGMLVVMN